MTNTITIPAELVEHVRSGLYEHLQDAYETLESVIRSNDRDDPSRASEQQRLLDQVQAAVAALRAAGHPIQPPQAIAISLIEHRQVIQQAIRLAVRTEQSLTEAFPDDAARRQRAHKAIAALRRLAKAIKVRDVSPEDAYLQRLVVLAVLDRPYAEGRTRAELHEILDDFPAEEVDGAAAHLAAVGLVRAVGQRVQATDGLSRIDELDFICI